MSKTENHPINVSSKVLRHISRGIYRSPAGALKELVSNAYDAGAKKVTINTSYPALTKITVTDNGNGMAKKDFTKIINQIGLSDKEVGDEIQVSGSQKKTVRKVIGHYGIGFLAIGQLTANAVIISKPKGTNKGFSATLNFDQFEQPKEKKSGDAINIGTCEITEVEFDGAKNESFTKVELDAIRPDVQRTIKGDDTKELNAVEVEKQKQYSSNFDHIINLLRTKEKQSSGKNKIILGDYSYEELLWELSVYAPLHFPNDMPVFKEGGGLYDFSKISNGFEFELVVDGFILKKPYDQEFWKEKDGFYPHIFKWVNEEYAVGKAVSAFLIYQPSTMIRPKRMQGVLIRQNGVAVGLYDLTFMKYPFNEGTKFNSLSGEIFASGLDAAMNVDRDSFNQTDDDYVALKNWFHGKLQKEVFSYILSFTAKSDSPSRQKNTDIVIQVLDLLLKDSKKVKKIKFKAFGKTDKRRVIVEKNVLTINSDHKDCNMSTVNRERLLLAAALIIDGYILPEDFDSVLNLIENVKKKLG